MTEREKMLAGQLYDCGDPELLAQWHKAKDLIRDYIRRIPQTRRQRTGSSLSFWEAEAKPLDHRSVLC